MKRFLYLAIITFFALPSAIAQEISLKGQELFGDIKARQIGPALMSGRINDIEMHPTDPRVMYVGAAGGGVWKSIDGGATFAPIFDEYVQSIGVVKLDPKRPDEVIWVGTGEIWTRNSVSIGNGLYKSTDGGKTWKEIPGFENSERIASIAINPNNTDEVYVGVLGALWSDSTVRGVYKTTDGGQTWIQVLYLNPSTGAGDVVMDPEDPRILYASMWQFRRTAWSFNSGGISSGLYKSMDAGATWKKIQEGFPSGPLGRIAIAMAPSDHNRLYAVLETGEKTTNGLWTSPDAGASWQHLNSDFGLTVRPFYFSRITIDPRDPNTIIKAGLTGSISRDGGKTFKDLGNMHGDIHDIAFHIHESDILFCGTDGGLYRSWNGGGTLEIVENLPISQFYQISVDNASPYHIYGGLQDNGSWWGPNSSPAGVNGRDWNSVGAGDGFRVLKHPTKNIIYSEMQGAENVWRYDIDRKKTKNIQPLEEKGKSKLRFNWNAPMALSAHNPDRFYMGSQYLHKSDDMGDTWTIISPDLTTNDASKQNQESSGGLSMDNSGAENHTTLFTIAESPLDENTIWVGTDDGNVQVTTDGGKTWNNVTPNLIGVPANTWVYHIEASVHGKGTAYAVFDGHTRGDFNTYVLKTTDFGKTWTNIVSDAIEKNAFARNIQEDYENENLLFLGTEFGLYITIDGGQNWSKFTNNMPSVAVHFIDLQKEANDLVMGTHGRGVIIIDDISPLRFLNQEVLSKDVHFFGTKPFTMTEQSGFAGSEVSETEFVGPSKASGARIVYYLKKRHTFGKMELEIQDMEGNKVATLSPGKSKGINVVNWEYTSGAPKMADAKTLSFSGFTPKRVPAGMYKVVLTKGKDRYEHTIELKYDETSLATLEERKEQERMTQVMFDMVEDLAYMVYQITEYQKAAQALILNHPKDKKPAEKLYDALERLRKDLVITTGDNYVGTAEPRLREKMGTLYSNIASSYDGVSASQMQNFRLISGEFELAQKRFEDILKKEGSKFESVLKKNAMELPGLLQKNTYLGKD